MSFVDELQEMLGSIDSKDGQAKPVSQPVKQPTVNVSPTALQLDTWAMERGERLHNESNAIARTECTPVEVADFFGSAFEYRPKLAESCASPLRHAFMKGLLESPDYQSLHKQTRNDELASEIAALSFCNKFVEYANDVDSGDATGPGDGDDIEGEAEASGRASSAVEEAAKDISDLNDLRGMGCGTGTGSGSPSPMETMKTYQIIKNNQNIRDILNLAGRYRRLARSCQSQKVVHGMDDTVGVKLGDQLPLAIGSELAMLAIPELEDDVLQRMLEGQLIQYDRRGVEPVGKGPVFVYTDSSGSMGKERLHHARAIAVTMAWIARSQGRWCCLSSFDDSLRTPVVFPPNWNSFQLLEKYINQGGGGGTSLEWLANTELHFQQTKAARGKTDIIIITDGCVGISPSTVSTFSKWKAENKCKLISMFVGCPASGELEDLSDQVFEMPDLSVNADGVKAAFSI